MVEQNISLDLVFGSLADPTRRDILQRVIQGELSVGEIAARYDMSLAAVSKHLKIMQQAKLITKRRRGKHQFVSATSKNFASAAHYMRNYESMWMSRLENLERIIEEQ